MDGFGAQRSKLMYRLLQASFQLTNDIQRLALAGCSKYILEPAGLDQVFLTTTVRKLLFDGIYFAFKNATGKGVACEIIRKQLGNIVANVRVIEHLNDTDQDCYRLAIFNYVRKLHLQAPRRKSDLCRKLRTSSKTLPMEFLR